MGKETPDDGILTVGSTGQLYSGEGCIIGLFVIVFNPLLAIIYICINS